MTTRRWPLALLFAIVLAVLPACGADRNVEVVPSSGGGAPAASGGLGTIAFIDANGCISRIDAQSGGLVASPFCAPSRAGVQLVTWLDAGTAAYATAESKALGWQVVDFASGSSKRMEMAEAPRVFLIPPQFYSPRGEGLEIDEAGTVYRDDVRIFPPESKSPDPATRLVTWSPDADWVLLSASTNKDLWIVGRSGENPRQLAAKSRGVASWFMPASGAMPHADLTCSVTTAASYSCMPALRTPLDNVLIRATGAAATLDLSWSACPGATGYEVEVYAAGSDSPAFRQVTAGTFSHPLLSSLPAGELRWRVRALIGPTPAPWAAERSVTIAGAGIG